MNQAGFVVIAMAGLWIAYLVPHRLRHRQQLLESRADDRFSDRLRVLRVARAEQAAGRGTQVARSDAARPARVLLHSGRVTDRLATATAPPTAAVLPAGPAGRSARRRPDAGTRGSARAGRGGGTMDRPHATRDRISADSARRTAAEHARRAAHLARCTAAARRRAALSAVLLLAVVGGWVTVGVASASLLLGAVPSVLLLGVLVLGRRAVVAGARADAAWEAGAVDRVPMPSSRTPRTPTVVGRAVHPSDATTEVMSRVPRQGEEQRVTERRATTPDVAERVEPSVPAGPTIETGEVGATTGTGEVATEPVSAAATTTAAEDVSTWAPVPVPRPAYTLKPAARRPEPAPLVLDEAPAVGTEIEATTAPASDDAAPTTGGLSLDAILARRRAAGE